MPRSSLRYLKFLPLVLALVSLTVWSIRLEGRVNAHDQLFNERKEQELQQWSNVQSQLGDIKRSIEKLDVKIETLNANQLEMSQRQQDRPVHWNPFK